MWQYPSRAHVFGVVFSFLPCSLIPTPYPLKNKRVAPFTYSAGGRLMHLRQLATGQLLVRTGGGFDDLIALLEKLPLGAPPEVALALTPSLSATLA
jgi:hypothetical protein